MQREEELLVELRRYTKTTTVGSYGTSASGSSQQETVTSLKHELNLAARVGQSLLTEIHSMESRLAIQQQRSSGEITSLKAENARLRSENEELAREHEIALTALAQQDNEISQLVAQLSAANSRGDRLARAAATADLLQDQVRLLEELHESHIAGSSIKRVTGKVDSQISSLEAIITPLKVKGLRGNPEQRLPTSYGLITPDTSRDLTQDPSQDSSQDTTCFSEIDTSIDTPLRPRLGRARSHESIFSVVATPDQHQHLAAERRPWWDSPANGPAAAVISSNSAHASIASPASAQSRSEPVARARLLSSMQQKQSPVAAPTRQEQPRQASWRFASFRGR